MDALIFDFDGVVIDSEPIHLEGFRRVLDTVGVSLSRDDYYEKYLGSDDHDCLMEALRAAGRDCSEELIASLVAKKTRFIQETFAGAIQPQPGAAELIRAAADAGIPLAVCSGALRREIVLAARSIGVLDCFGVIVAAEDVDHGKPDPEGYVKTLSQLSDLLATPLEASRTIVIEDSPAGIQAGKGAGMKVLAVTASYPAESLREADRVVDCLTQVDVVDLGRMA